ncbi:MAG: hypothetical protein R3B72_12765 [Polyangiaceae bacterium]
MSHRACRILIRSTPHYRRYRLADELEPADDWQHLAPTPRMVPRVDLSRLLETGPHPAFGRVAEFS